MTQPIQASGSQPLARRAGGQGEPASPESPAGHRSGPAEGFYSGTHLPDFKVARDWKPGQAGMSGTEANQKITATYTALDTAMTEYLGRPRLANWATFGKYASQNAGNQIVRLEAFERFMREKSVGSFFSLLTDTLFNPIETFRKFKALLSADVPGHSLAEKAELLRDALVFGNTAIIADIAPAYDAFLRAESAGKDGVAMLRSVGYGRAPKDPQGFMLQAFEKFAAARAITDRLAREFPPETLDWLDAAAAPAMSRAGKVMPPSVKARWEEATQLLAERSNLMFEANLLMGVQEQLLSLQTPEVFENPHVVELMAAFSGEMTLQDGNGAIKLLNRSGGNWAEFKTRMGLKEIPLDSHSKLFDFKVTEPDGITRRYQVDTSCRAGDIASYMAGATTTDKGAPGLLAGKPEALSRHYTANPLHRVGDFFSNLRRRLLG